MHGFYVFFHAHHIVGIALALGAVGLLGIAWSRISSQHSDR